eukprot:TRINITY_DN35659_c0_g1_i1.p1 TRINITY_DN35659_c0_g1~~TRINITY_DN35659_c0_g1_i1.p1  ORF type:complete len:161 (+),score=64.11 TRINITY_DN35659_c0_g1_i1:261-743(+)
MADGLSKDEVLAYRAELYAQVATGAPAASPAAKEKEPSKAKESKKEKEPSKESKEGAAGASKTKRFADTLPKDNGKRRKALLKHLRKGGSVDEYDVVVISNGPEAEDSGRMNGLYARVAGQADKHGWVKIASVVSREGKGKWGIGCDVEAAEGDWPYLLP